MVERSLFLVNGFFLLLAFTNVLLNMSVAEPKPQYLEFCEKFINEYLTLLLDIARFTK